MKNSPISDTMSSISCRFFRYLGHTYPSKYPGRSGGVYTLELSITGKVGQRLVFFISHRLYSGLSEHTIIISKHCNYIRVLKKNISPTLSSLCRHHKEFQGSISCPLIRSRACQSKHETKSQTNNYSHHIDNRQRAYQEREKESDT
jgi:hypothetical protein